MTTNREKLNKLSNEEWIRTVNNFFCSCECCAFEHNSSDCKTHECSQGRVKWLESEVKDEE